jgi:uncharacterized membrane protein HdeD (DUF308 family)
VRHLPWRWKKKRGNNMSGRTILGIVLLVVGIIALGYQGISYTTQKKVVDLGPIHATKEEHHNIPIPPVVGAIALIGGLVVLFTGRRGE